MASKIKILKPSTLFVTIPKNCTRIELFRNKQLYFFRILDGEEQDIKINVCHSGTYFLTKGDVNKITDIQINPLNIVLPAPDRQRLKPFVIRYSSNFSNGSPARNFTHKGLIEFSDKFKQQCFCIRVFILLHEVAHFFYKDETLCDLWACNEFIKRGYNNSSALYALTKVLNCNNPRNIARIETIFSQLKKV